MKMHYFEQDKADEDDFILNGCKQQGYVPPNCLLGGALVHALVRDGKDPCEGCESPREICKGRSK